MLLRAFLLVLLLVSTPLASPALASTSHASSPRASRAFAAAAARAPLPELKSLVGTRFTARVSRVVDGDTLRVVDGRGRELVIRLEGIDTPERGEPFSTQARNAARVLLVGKIAELRATDVDRYGRLVARVYVDGTDTSLALVDQGMACHFTRYSSDPQLAQAQEQARRHGRGFWAPGASRPACARNGQRPPGRSRDSRP